nr:G-protein coupled receptor GRL101-like isoform X1 [Dermatophagoides farinae]
MCGCMEHEFECNQTCIDSLLIRCDTKIDCQDGGDENNCETYVCPETHFKCNNHFCIPTENVCDFQDNCGDNSDEEACTHRACWFGEYKCDNGQCIQAYGVCNGQNDCIDGSDEKQCNPMDFVTCNQTGIRVHRSLWCDGQPDCSMFHEDELGCREQCQPNEFRCTNSRCIPMGNRCDTICDCATHCEDELDCDEYYTKIDGVTYCSRTTTISCSLSDDDQYIDRCLNKQYVCNGYNDCPRLFDDEYGCPFGGYTEQSCLKMNDHFWCPVEHRCLPKSVHCNHIQECFDGFDELNCDTKPCSSNEYQCLNGQCIDQQKRCNSKFDCYDKSDEIGCRNHSCPITHRRCHSGQCIPASSWCDYFNDCLDHSDEQNCNTSSTSQSSSNDCDYQTQFRCDNGQCISAEFRCLLTSDPRKICADRSNLNGCRNFSCPSNSVKCAGSFCVDSTLKCNERLDCPVLSDWADEQLCPFYCSDSRLCQCIDTTINCSGHSLLTIPGSIEDQILRMILKGNQLGLNLTLNMFNRLDRMHMIDLSDNQIKFILPGLFRKLWKLRILHLRKNLIETIESYTFTGLPNLGTFLNGNHIRLIREHAFSGLASLKTLDLSNQHITSLQKNSFSGLRSLKNLDLSNNQINELPDGVFSGLSSVISIDLRGNKIKSVGSKAFQGMNALKQITFDEFHFCCLVRHVKQCYPEPNEFSSCEDLMSNTILRICIWCLGSIALIGNMFVILWRLRYKTINRVHSFLIINLALGDLLMGIYLLIIASVDSYYRGIYFIVDARWRHSSLCHFAGFLSTLSSEISVFFLIVITIDRLITITFPFRIYRLRSKDAKLIIISLWLVAIIISGLPLIPVEYFDNFYGRSGVCLALHITHERPNGWEYSVFVFLVLNLISFTLICGSYLWMFIVARKTQKAAKSNGRRFVTTETKVQNRMARRMMFIVMTDFCCWMPIIGLGIVSLFGVRIPPQIFAWIAVFILPLNAAVNPTLYTLSGLPLRRSSSNGFSNHIYSTRKPGSPNYHQSLSSHGKHIGSCSNKDTKFSSNSTRTSNNGEQFGGYCKNRRHFTDHNHQNSMVKSPLLQLPLTSLIGDQQSNKNNNEFEQDENDDTSYL